MNASGKLYVLAVLFPGESCPDTHRTIGEIIPRTVLEAFTEGSPVGSPLLSELSIIQKGGIVSLLILDLSDRQLSKK
jgi:hypothetical protein